MINNIEEFFPKGRMIPVATNSVGETDILGLEISHELCEKGESVYYFSIAQTNERLKRQDEKIRKSRCSIYSYKFYVNDKARVTVQDLVSEIGKGEDDVYVIDFFQLIHVEPNELNSWMEMAKHVCPQLEQIAKDRNIRIILLTQFPQLGSTQEEKREHYLFHFNYPPASNTLIEIDLNDMQ